MVPNDQTRQEMPLADQEEEKRRLYGVDRFKSIIDAQASRPHPGPLKLIITRAKSALDSVAGLSSIFLGMAVILMGPAAAVIGVLYGPLGFLAAFTVVVGSLAIYVERKVGASIQFGDYSLTRRVAGQVLGFGLILLILLTLLVILARVSLRFF